MIAWCFLKYAGRLPSRILKFRDYAFTGYTSHRLYNFFLHSIHNKNSFFKHTNLLNGSLEQASVMLSHYLGWNTTCTSWLSKYGNLVRISSKSVYVLLHPDYRLTLIPQSKITCACEIYVNTGDLLVDFYELTIQREVGSVNLSYPHSPLHTSAENQKFFPEMPAWI